jgi:tetratricopeptide (TPR) repeat protein
MKGRKLFPIIMAAAMLSLGSCGTDKNEEAIKFFKRGNFKLKEQEYNEAIHWYGEALNKKPDFADIYNNRGLAYQKSDKPEKALDDFNKAIAVDSKFWEAYYNRAELLFNLGNYQEAIQDLNKIGKVYKDSSFYYVTLGNVKTQTQDYSGLLLLMNELWYLILKMPKPIPITGICTLNKTIIL